MVEVRSQVKIFCLAWQEFLLFELFFMISYIVSRMLKIIVPSFKKFLNISKNKYFLASFIFLLLVCLINLGFNLYYVDKIFPGIEVLGIGLGGRTITDASSYLSQKITVPEKI